MPNPNIHYLYFKDEAEIRFDVICPDRIHVMVTKNKERDLLFNLIVSAEQAREIWKGLVQRGADKAWSSNRRKQLV